MDTLKEGKRAPAFTLKDKDGTAHRLSDIDSDFVIVYFYPRDNTPGCTIQAKGFSKDRKKFEELGTEIIGISGGDESTKEKFCRKHKLQIPLLSDPDFKIAAKYGAYGAKQFMGKKFKGILRKTYILDEKKNIIKIYDKVKPITHSKEVRDFIKSLKII